jgi:hypothetical protein
LALLITLVGFTLTFLYHVSPLLLLLGVAMIPFGAWKMRPLGFEGAVMLGFMLILLALYFGPLVVGIFMHLFFESQ